AFKWADELAQTTLREIEWSPSRTGLINPVAIFDPVELEGTSVSRASVHNISILRQLKLGIGDQITVYKANMIIPQIAENLTGSDTLQIPDTCPACGGPTVVDAGTLLCKNPHCPAKMIKSYTLFVSRDAMNIDGLSEMTLEKLLGMGLLKEFADLYRLSEHKDRITALEGFGEKSFDNLMESIDRSRSTTLPRLIFALGIDGIGSANAKLLARHFHYDLLALRTADAESLSMIDKIGPVLAGNITAYFADTGNCERLEHLLAELQIEEAPKEIASDSEVAGKVFVITGSVAHFSNRKELQELIEQQGGKVTGSVTSKTDYLINNDITSTSGKNKKAKELGVPIINEETILSLLKIDI
nr:NAD-dependent DNA ligase LigA [Lachnospiraceae bacterium]